MANSSPIRYGFDAVKRAPAVAVIEIAWRWTFGVIATVLLLFGVRAFLAGLSVSPSDEQAIRGSDPSMAAAALAHLFQQQGVLQRLFEIIAAVVVPSVLVWIVTATFGRIAVLKRLLVVPHINTAAVLYLTVARAALLFACFVFWYVWMVICAFIAMTGEAPNYPLYLLLSFVALPVIAIAWGILNWILSFAPLFVDAAGAMESYRRTLRLAREERAAFVSVTSWLGFPRLAGMVLVLILAVIALFAIQSAVFATVVLTLVTLVYCAFADYLYVVRLAAYAQIARELPIATAATPL
jgi:hypothetical protein